MALGAQCRWTACNIYSTQNEVAAALSEAGEQQRGQETVSLAACLQRSLKQKDSFGFSAGAGVRTVGSSLNQSGTLTANV